MGFYREERDQLSSETSYARVHPARSTYKLCHEREGGNTH
jgi:hypothetical protein